MKKDYLTPVLQCTECSVDDIMSISLNSSPLNEPGIKDIWDEIYKGVEL